MAMDCCLICFRVGGKDFPEQLDSSLNSDLYRNSKKLEVFQRFFKLINRHVNDDSLIKKCDVDEEINKRKSLFNDCAVNSGVPACKECLEVMTSFCEVYHKIKTLELLLNHKMGTLMNIMFCAGKVPARVACFKEAFANQLQLDTSGEQVNGILQYKKELIAKCSKKLNETHPKLTLTRLSSMAKEKDVPKSPPELVQPHQPASSSDLTEHTGVEAERNLEHGTSKTDLCRHLDNDVYQEDFQPISSPSPVPDLVSLELPCKLERLDEFNPIGDEAISRMEANLEMKSLCPSEIANEIKSQTTSPDNAKGEEGTNSGSPIEDIKPSLQTSLLSMPTATFSRRSLRTVHKCNKCRRTFSSKDKLTGHQKSQTCSSLIESNEAEEMERTEEDNLSLESSEDGTEDEEDDVKPSTEKLFIPWLRKQNPKREPIEKLQSKVCPVCDKQFPTLKILSATRDKMISKHVLQAHPEAFQTLSGNLEPFACPVFYCSVSFDKVSSIRDHCLKMHRPEFKFRTRFGVSNRLQNDLEEPLRCPFGNCDVACLNKAVLLIHMRAAHPSEWNSKNLSILSRKFFKERMEKSKNDGFPLGESDCDEKEEEKKLDKMLFTKCPDCSRLFNYFREMILHRKKAHSDKKDIPSQEGNKFTVELLTPNEAAKSGQKDENYEVYTKIELASLNVFTCSKGTSPCGQLFLFEKDLEDHSKLHGEFNCHFCEVVDEYAVNLAKHELNEHTAEGTPKSRVAAHCPRCKVGFGLKSRYFQHFVTEHLGLARLMEECCPICRDPQGLQSWTRDDNRLQEYRHLTLYHNLLAVKDPTNDVFRCEEKGCSAYYLSFYQLRNHMRLVHSSEKDDQKFRRKFPQKLNCKDCGILFRNRFALKKHRLRVHVNEMDKISCTVEGCGAQFEVEEELRKHLKITHEQIGFKKEVCPKCGKSITGPGAMAAHMKAHERKEKMTEVNAKAVCEICGKSFPTKEQLNRHILIVHKGPEAWKFECNVCGKKCVIKQKLEEHMRTHTKEKPFVCQICGAAYGHRHNLRIHVNSKHGDVMEDVPKKRDTTNLFRRKKKAAASTSPRRKAKKGKIVESSEANLD